MVPLLSVVYILPFLASVSSLTSGIVGPEKNLLTSRDNDTGSVRWHSSCSGHTRMCHLPDDGY